MNTRSETYTALARRFQEKLQHVLEDGGLPIRYLGKCPPNYGTEVEGVVAEVDLRRVRTR